ncbi:phage major capsid protein [uncultured Dialister sp.]|uniref:phage major capsid protein n=1 Tax=uncultured Dialister sp. TaxID=278064 RepID=UPI002594D80A|nr:phage major capsid protein [uncultured Dialister sp.]
MNIKKLLDEIEAKKNARAALVKKSEASQDVNELRSLQGQIKDLSADIEFMQGLVDEERAAEAQRTAENAQAQAPAPAQAAEPDTRTQAVNEHAEHEAQEPEHRSFKPGEGFKAVAEGRQNRTPDQNRTPEQMEQRGKALKEGRSITVATGSIVLPHRDAANINDTFQQVSSLLDAVDYMELQGGESFKQPYAKDSPDGNYTEEGGEIADTDAAFGYAEITKSKITGYSEITDEVEKLPAANYAAFVEDSVTKSTRKKLAKEIMLGDGTAGHLTGIFSTKCDAIPADSDITVSAIDNTTLDEIVFSYGGDESVESQAALILSKEDLKAFASVRSADGKPFYNIVNRGGFGTINSVPFFINSACKAVANSKTASGAYCMAYGDVKNYKLVAFSPLDVQKSTDFKFKEDMISYKSRIYAGGNVVAYKGFVRVKKGTVASTGTGK